MERLAMTSLLSGMNHISLLLSIILLSHIASGERYDKYKTCEKYLRQSWKWYAHHQDLHQKRRSNRKVTGHQEVSEHPKRAYRWKNRTGLGRSDNGEKTSIVTLQTLQDRDSKEPPTCGVIAQDDEIDVRIVGGTEAKLGTWPWIAVLGYKVNNNEHLVSFKCGGVIITQKHILTAAHCVQYKQDLFCVRLGDLDLSTDADGARPRDIKIIGTKIHEDYDPDTYANDIAILTMQIKVTFTDLIRPACLPLSPEIRNQNFTSHPPLIAGWGRTSYMGETSPKLLELRVPVIDNQICAQKYKKLGSLISNGTLCAGYLTGDHDACQGDSGGPLMWSYDKVYYVIGVVSFGFHCAEPDYPGVYTRVAKYTDWILQNLNLKKAAIKYDAK